MSHAYKYIYSMISTSFTIETKDQFEVVIDRKRALITRRRKKVRLGLFSNFFF